MIPIAKVREARQAAEKARRTEIEFDGALAGERLVLETMRGTRAELADKREDAVAHWRSLDRARRRELAARAKAAREARAREKAKAKAKAKKNGRRKRQ